MTTANAPTTSRLSGFAFPAAIGLSACLLFSLELMVGQLMLPLLGGAPSVWATTLGFFQVVLLLGYLYAHVSVTRLGRLGPIVHLALAAAAGIDLLVGPRLADLRFDSLPPVLEVLATLSVGVGPPAFVLCTTTPLISAWLTATLGSRGERTDAEGDQAVGGDPYRLYVVSNAGSLIALLAYPLAIEPALGLNAQRGIWNAAFFALVVLVAFTGALRFAAERAADPSRTPSPGTGALDAGLDPADPANDRIGWRRSLRWLFLAAVPCGLLSAVTNFITADLISTPLLWVGPLAIYLATFVVAFSAKGTRVVAVATTLAPAMATLLWIPIGYSPYWPAIALLALEMAGFGVIALTLHGRLAADRPGPSRLTFFYLVVSAGGVVGGAFVGFIAPVVFPGVWEYPILLIAAIAGAPVVGVRAVSGATAAASAAAASARAAAAAKKLDFSPFVSGASTRLKPYAVVGAACAAAVAISSPKVLVVMIPFLLIGGAILALGAKPALMAATTAVMLVATVGFVPSETIFQSRDYFGVLTVKRVDGVTTEYHGTTNHGSQFDDPAKQRIPRDYYVTTGPLGDVMTLAQARGALDIGVVGLGSGNIATYERANDHMTFFEIDPAVITAAEDPKLFTFLSNAPNKPAVILGDGRVELRKIPDHSYDVLILDAFSGDSIPTHLLSVEALTDDLRVLKPGGLLLVHVSNRYYNLAPAVAGGTAQIGMTSMTRVYQPTQAEKDAGALGSQWVVASADPSQLASLPARGWQSISPAEPITDDHPDVLRFAMFGSWLSGR